MNKWFDGEVTQPKIKCLKWMIFGFCMGGRLSRAICGCGRKLYSFVCFNFYARMWMGEIWPFDPEVKSDQV